MLIGGMSHIPAFSAASYYVGYVVYITTLRCEIVIHRVLRINIQYQKFYLQIFLDTKSILQ
jgi:hypothetical protein